MQASKVKILFLLFFLTCGCAPSFYRVSNTQGRKVELSVTPDRFLVRCEKVSDENELYMFLIDILDDENTVLSSIQGNNSDREDCEMRKKKVNMVLSTGKNIYFAGIGDVLEPKKRETYTYTFPKHGTFNGNGRFVQFMVIANENGACYGAYLRQDEACPGGEFPIRESK